MAGELRIAVLGGLTIECDGRATTGWASRKAQALVVYLAVTGRRHARDWLATLLWNDRPQQRASGNLSVVLSSLRKAIGPYVEIDRNNVGLVPDAQVVIDTRALEEAVTRLARQAHLSQRDLAELLEVLELYRGDFLAGFHIRDAEQFDEWAWYERARLRQLAVTGYSLAVEAHIERGQTDAGLVLARRLLDLDPLLESTYRQLMILYVQRNDRAGALAQYAECERVLLAELDVEPDGETQELARAIRHGDDVLPAGACSDDDDDRPRHNLPVTVDGLIGRVAEIRRIAARLQDPACRLLTLVGPGGVGKTRLAIEIGSTLAEHFRDGVGYVPLAPLTDGSDLPGAVAEALRINPSGTQSVATDVLEFLTGKEMLLILDNLEHLLCPLVIAFLNDLLRHAQSVPLLVTSRERLNLSVEWLEDVHGLAIPAMDDDAAAEQAEAVRLFVHCVQRVRPEFAVTAGNRAAIIQFCRLVGGMPLAIELAAGWTRVLSVGQMVEELSRGIDFLATNLRNLPQRHRSIRAVCDSSWQMLTPDEQEVYRRLAVFRGGFTLEGARRIADATPFLLVGLVDKSLLQRDDGGRYRRHPLLWQYAYDRLAADVHLLAEATAAHIDMYVDLLQQCEVELVGPHQVEARNRIQDDLDNLLAAWRAAVDMHRYDAVDRMARPLYLFFNGNRFARGRELFDWTARALTGHDLPADLQIRLGIYQGVFLTRTGAYAEAETLLTTNAARAQEAGLHREGAVAVRNLGVIQDDRGDYQTAMSYLEEALDLVRKSGDLYEASGVLNSMGIVFWSMGEYDRAEETLMQSLALTQELGPPHEIAVRYSNLSTIAYARREFDAAIDYCRQAQEIFQAMGNDWGVSTTFVNLADTYRALGDNETALDLQQEALVLARRVGHAWGVAFLHLSMAMTQFALARVDAAFSALDMAIREAFTIHSLNVLLGAIGVAGQLQLELGRPDQAAELLLVAIRHPATFDYMRDDFQQSLDDAQAVLSDSDRARIDRQAAAATPEAVAESILQR